MVNIEDGVAILSNWEGEYFGPDVVVGIDVTIGDEVFQASILDNDTDVWCDNQVVTSVDENNQVTYASLCSENYERYLLWSLEINNKSDDDTDSMQEDDSTEEESFENDELSE